MVDAEKLDKYEIVGGMDPFVIALSSNISQLRDDIFWSTACDDFRDFS